MEHFIKAIENAISQENWHAALAVSLMMPDICGKITFPESRTRYADWFNKYVGENYKTNWNSKRMKWFKQIMKEGHISKSDYDRLNTGTKLTGGDCYALRCAYLHGGDGNTELHQAKEIVDRVSFYLPNKKLILHGTEKADNHLVLQIDTFCNDIKVGVIAWEKEFGKEKPEKYNEMLQIQNVFDLA